MSESEIELSVVMPCLNEEQTVGVCVEECLEVISHQKIKGEVIVVDNGSEDDSKSVIQNSGAKLVEESIKGYGAALLAGFSKAQGKYVIMMDSDGTYDPAQIPTILNLLRKGNEFVNGSRLSGNMEKGAMPFLHKWFGVPLLGWLVRVISQSTLTDSHCGIRGFSNKKVKKLHLVSEGMELASEMIIKAARNKLKTVEFAANYRVRHGSSKLNTFKDGWRHLKLIIAYSPSHFFILPGLFFALTGFILNIILFNGPMYIGQFMIDYHFMVAFSLIMFIGIQISIVGIYGKTYALSQGIIGQDPVFSSVRNWLTFEKGILVGFVILLSGVIVALYVLGKWLEGNFSFQNENASMIRQAILSMSLIISGMQIMSASLLLGLFPLTESRMKEKDLNS